MLLIPKRHRQTDRRQTDGQTDERLTIALPRSALASRGKNTTMIHQVTLSCCSDICVAECCSSILCDELVKMCVVMQYVHESHGLQQNPKKNLKTIIKYKPSHKLFSDYSAIKMF